MTLIIKLDDPLKTSVEIKADCPAMPLDAFAEVFLRPALQAIGYTEQTVNDLLGEPQLLELTAEPITDPEITGLQNKFN